MPSDSQRTDFCHRISHQHYQSFKISRRSVRGLRFTRHRKSYVPITLHCTIVYACDYCPPLSIAGLVHITISPWLVTVCPKWLISRACWKILTGIRIHESQRGGGDDEVYRKLKKRTVSYRAGRTTSERVNVWVSGYFTRNVNFICDYYISSFLHSL